MHVCATQIHHEHFTPSCLFRYNEALRYFLLNSYTWNKSLKSWGHLQLFSWVSMRVWMHVLCYLNVYLHNTMKDMILVKNWRAKQHLSRTHNSSPTWCEPLLELNFLLCMAEHSCKILGTTFCLTWGESPLSSCTAPPDSSWGGISSGRSPSPTFFHLDLCPGVSLQPRGAQQTSWGTALHRSHHLRCSSASLRNLTTSIPQHKHCRIIIGAQYF